MPPVSSAKVRTYEPLPPPKQQKTFTHPRRSIKAKPLLPKLSKKQSTLTQLDFGRTPMSSREAIYISSDEDFEEPQPKKKRRVSKFDNKDADQSTMTQYERGGFPASARRSRLPDRNDDAFNVWEDYDPDKYVEEVGQRQRSRAMSASWLHYRDDAKENEETILEIPESSQVEDVEPPSLGEDTAGCHTQDVHQTPRKSGSKIEVPSSQSPPSTKHSKQECSQHDVAQRSPLQEKGHNAQPSQSIDSRYVARDSRERVQSVTRNVPLNDGNPSLPMECTRDTAYAIATFPKLQRTRTVQDSQVDECGETIIANSAEDTGRTLRRTVTVQDSEADEEELETYEDQGDDLDNDLERTGCFEDDLEPSTFDPAYSALDRDAARFGQTQTQPRSKLVEDSCVDDATDDGDLDQEYSADVNDDNVQPALESALEQDHHAETAEPVVDQPIQQKSNDASAPTPGAATEALPDDSAYESGLPSSPPPQALRPSQVSTVVPTQMSPTEPLAAADTQLSADPASTEAFTLPSSPPPPSSGMPGTLSSSPLLLPPWRTPEKAGFVDKAPETQGHEPSSDRDIGTLVDFSLPPPPPISSSRRQTPASSMP